MPFIWDTRNKTASVYASWKKSFHKRMYGSCAVLLYHRVTRYETDPQLLCVNPEHFNDHIGYLEKNYRVLRIDEWKDYILKKKKFPPDSVLITFDDGYADNFLEALPILETHKVQALFYICTGNIGSDREFWWDETERLILLYTRPGEELKIQIEGHDFRCSGDPFSRNKFYEDILPRLRDLPPRMRDKILLDIASQTRNPVQRKSHRSMTWDEVKKLSVSASAVIGAHTHNHPSLSILSAEEQRNEIHQSKSLLEVNTGIPILHFSYPFGTRRDYSQATIRICKDEGFEIVTANFPYIAHSHSDPFQVPRFLVRDWDLDQFKNELKRFLN